MAAKFYCNRQEFAVKFSVTDGDFVLDMDLMVGETPDLHRVMLRCLHQGAVECVIVLYPYDLQRLHDVMLGQRTKLLASTKPVRFVISPNLEIVRAAKPGEILVTSLVEVRPGMTAFLQTGNHRTSVPLSVRNFDNFMNILPSIVKAVNERSLQVAQADPPTLTFWKKTPLPEFNNAGRLYLTREQALHTAGRSERISTRDDFEARIAQDYVATMRLLKRRRIELGTCRDPICVDDLPASAPAPAPRPVIAPGPTHILSTVQVRTPTKEAILNYFAMRTYRDAIVKAAGGNRQIHFTPENSIQAFNQVRGQAAYFHYLCTQCLQHLKFVQSSPTLDYVVEVLNDWGEQSPYLNAINSLNIPIVENRDLSERADILELLYLAYMYKVTEQD